MLSVLHFCSWSCAVTKILILQTSMRQFVSLTDRHIFEEKVAPFILNIEEEAEHQCDVHDADEEDNNHSGVNRDTTPRACLRTLMSHSSVSQ